MNNELWLCLSSSESEDEYNLKIIRKQIRASSDPLSMPTAAFKQRFRLTKEAFKYVLTKLNFEGSLSTSVPPTLQLAATLSLLASGTFQHNVGDDFLLGLAQSTVCKIVKKVANEIQLKLCPKFINFSPEESTQCMESFMKKYKIPGVIGCIDGTHVGLQRPEINEHTYFNRKGFHCLNSMIICDHEYKILAINSKYGGASHDSHVWKHSDERDLLEQLYTKGSKNVWLLGDSGYPLEPWCLTPFRSPKQDLSKIRFNEVHSKARCVVERTIGIAKGRWKILYHDKRSRYTPEKMALFSNVCAELHNICIKYKVPSYTALSNMQESTFLEIDTEPETQLTRIGAKIRNAIMISLTSHNRLN